MTEKPCNPSNSWTLDTLKEFLMKEITNLNAISLQRHETAITKIENLDKIIETRDIATQRALQIALESMNHRLMGMNEFRQSLQDQRLSDEKNRTAAEEKFLPTNVYNISYKVLEENFKENQKRISEMEKKFFVMSEVSGQNKESLNSKYLISMMIFSGLSFVISMATIIWNIVSHSH